MSTKYLMSYANSNTIGGVKVGGGIQIEERSLRVNGCAAIATFLNDPNFIIDVINRLDDTGKVNLLKLISNFDDVKHIILKQLTKEL